MKNLKHILLAGFLFLYVNGFSQSPIIEDPADGDATVPVDGGISLLLAAGVAYGASRWRKASEND
jgi:hypothetical protein